MKVLTVGSFDILHPGHLHLFRESRMVPPLVSQVTLIVGVNSDRFITRYRGRPPVMGQYDRMRLVRELRSVDDVIVNDLQSLVPMVAQVRPDYLTIGDDWKDRDYAHQIGMTEQRLNDLGCQLVYIERVAGLSSTWFRKRVVARESYGVDQ